MKDLRLLPTEATKESNYIVKLYNEKLLRIAYLIDNNYQPFIIERNITTLQGYALYIMNN